MDDELPPLPESTVNFDDPPVGEVALAVQLAGAVTDDAQTLGSFWPKVKADYPRLEPQIALPPMAEQFGAPGPPQIMFQFERPGNRYWFLNDDLTQLVQVQSDRFAYNWRKEPAPGEQPEAQYPRYRHLRERFWHLYREFVSTCVEAGHDLTPTWCEITYINPIEVERTDGGLDLSVLLNRVLRSELSRVTTPEDTTFNERYLLHRHNEPYGRFYVTAAPALRVTDGHPLYVVTLTMRALAASPDTTGVIRLLDEGHDVIVNSFKEMTTPAMHDKWGLRDAG